MNTLQKIEEVLENKKPSIVDDLKSYLMGKKKKLSDTQKRKLERLTKVRALCSTYHKDQIIKIITTDNFFELNKKISLRQGYVIYNQMVELWSDTNQVNKNSERHFSRAKYLELAKKLEDAGDFVGAMKARELADKVIGLFEHSEGEKIEPSQFFANVTIVRSSNPQILKEKIIQIDNENE